MAPRWKDDLISDGTFPFFRWSAQTRLISVGETRRGTLPAVQPKPVYGE